MKIALEFEEQAVLPHRGVTPHRSTAIDHGLPESALVNASLGGPLSRFRERDLVQRDGLPIGVLHQAMQRVLAADT